MWVEFLLWGIAGGLFIEAWQAVARLIFEGPRSWRSPQSPRFRYQLIAALTRLAIAGCAGLAAHLPLEDPAPLTSFLGGAFIPLFTQDVVRRFSDRTSADAALPKQPTDQDDSVSAAHTDSDGQTPTAAPEEPARNTPRPEVEEGHES
jgi:hypothetical protein